MEGLLNLFKSFQNIILVCFLLTAIEAESSVVQTLQQVRSDLSCQTMAPVIQKLPEEALIQDLQNAHPEERAKNLILIQYHSWNLRVLINDNLAAFKDCEKSLRELINTLRGIEDLAGLIYTQTPQQKGSEIDFQNQPIPMKAAANYYGYITKEGFMNPAALDLNSGDLLVTRGTSFFSATLSSITENPGDFSHFVLVHKNDVDNKVETLESYAQTGGIARYDIDFALKNENARILWLRPRFKEVAKTGSEYFYQQILVEEKGLKPRTKYDYNMDLKTQDRMTCSEIAYWSYLKASNGNIVIPESKSKMPATLAPILDLAKIPKEPMLSPQDMEVDSRFEILGEFRDYRLVQDSRMRDAILRNIFSWINTKNYVLHHNINSFLLSYLIHPISKTPLWPMVKGMLNISIPKEAPKGFVRLLYQINDISEKIYSELELENKKKMQEQGFPLTKTEMDQIIESIRSEDLRKYQDHKKSKFHNYFHP